jgi:hypothetical protein
VPFRLDLMARQNETAGDVPFRCQGTGQVPLDPSPFSGSRRGDWTTAAVLMTPWRTRNVEKNVMLYFLRDYDGEEFVSEPITTKRSPAMLPHASLARQQIHRACQGILEDIMSQENAFYFFRPVQPEEDGAPNYFNHIVRPMCILQVQEKLDHDGYECLEEFVTDMRQIWENAEVFNKASHVICRTATKLSQRFELLIAALPHSVAHEGGSQVQRYVELRFKSYRSQKKSHQ